LLLLVAVEVQQPGMEKQELFVGQVPGSGAWALEMEVLMVVVEGQWRYCECSAVLSCESVAGLLHFCSALLFSELLSVHWNALQSLIDWHIVNAVLYACFSLV
jgi:hypothetical protein